jgi:hypothetical protein
MRARVPTGARRSRSNGLDNHTTWRATARGVTANTLVGESTGEARVTKDLVARLAVPRVLVAGDEAQLVSVVTNRTRTALPDVRTGLTATGAARVLGAATRAKPASRPAVKRAIAGPWRSNRMRRATVPRGRHGSRSARRARGMPTHCNWTCRCSPARWRCANRAAARPLRAMRRRS